MIATFKDKRAAALFRREALKRFPPDLVEPARRKLAMLDRAATLDSLREPYSNHLEALKDDRAGQHSIRINLQWRLCFIWREGAPHEVEIVDYH